MIRALLASLLAAATLCEAAELPTTPTSAKAANDAQFTLRDGTVIFGKTELKNIEVNTAYGTLTIPMGDVIRLRVGKRSDRDLKTKIDRAIADLGSKDFAARDQATTELSKLGKLAYTELRKAATSDDLEVKERSAKLLEDLGNLDDDADIPPEDDHVVTPSFTVVGAIKIESLTIATKFGPLKVSKKDLAKMSLGEVESLTRTASVAARATPGKMIATSVRVKRGDRLTITSTGTISYRNYGGTQFTPEGSANYGTWGDNFLVGSLIGKIGSSGTIFKVGERYSEKAEADGELFLGIAANDSGANYGSGEYKARIQVQPGTN